MLADKTFHYIYSNSDEHKPIDFCLQALSNSIRLDLGLGYFSSTSFNILSLGMAHFIVNNGIMNLYINKYITPQDYMLLRGDYDSKFDDDLVISFTELRDTLSKRDEHFFKCLSYLIKNNRVNVKIVILSDGGLPHEKYGIFTDEKGNKILFTGSMNLTAAAILGNLETVECTCSWKGEDSKGKVFTLEQHFNKVWNGDCDGVLIYDAKHFCNHIMKIYRDQDIDELMKNEEKFLENYKVTQRQDNRNTPHFPLKYKDGARPYQEEAYEAWVKNGKNGIFAMATGTGKTVTALNCALHEYNKDNYYNLLILVPSLDLLSQWQDELIGFNFKNSINVSSLNTSWRKDLMNIYDKVKRKKIINYAIVSTYDSFVNRDFQYLLPALSDNLILIADEAHNIGGKLVKKCFRNMTISRKIALSATPERIYDEDGTAEIGSFFNDKYPYVYSFPMSKAIKENRLCKYYYYPKIAYLNDDEMELYSYLTKKLALLWDDKNEKFKDRQTTEKLLLNRKRIIHKCDDKLRAYRDIISEIGENNLRHTFVYAPQGKYEKMGIDDEVSLTEEDDISFIQKLLDETKNLFPNKRCNTFTGKDAKEKRSILLKSFETGELDVLFAMKCLDEGVDVPRAERGIFTSSTCNPREFIQRRGRLLRNHPDKMFSYIYDIVVVPATINREDSSGRMESNLVKNELKRVAYFATLSLNCHANNGAFELLNDVAHHFGIVWSELLTDIEQ
ncbi:MAG: DEAD/DEAH box helicase family protein [Prevotella sp.]|nr:DEAD/DEAH box helicase family protein [Prevotella sp.]